MAGLIDEELGLEKGQMPKADLPTASESMTPQMSVANNVDTLIDKNSPLMQGARTRAAQESNQRGLINSSMGVQAGEMAAYSAALPIAQADASTAANFGLKEMSGKQESALAGQSGLINSALTSQKQRGDVALQELRGTQSKQLAEIEAGYKTLIAANDSAGKVYQQTVDAMNKILTDPGLTSEGKTNAMSWQANVLKSGLGIIGAISNIKGLEGLLNFDTGATGTPTSPESGKSSGDDGTPEWFKEWAKRQQQGGSGGSAAGQDAAV